ncbi:phosphoglycerate mutase family protein [Erythrobacteraceae bacterium E2-1 Yellow Sea]|nr:phosphoglycerate mutase family protein [Erythrobacteraceae bacterium E2-1 Yellow Sea]
MFVIVRHGNTFEAGETPRRIGARTDLPLTQAGLDQARALGRYFAEQNVQFGRALIAPLLRTRETAQLILAAQVSPPDPQICGWLREIDHGPDENQPEEAVLGRIGQDALDKWDATGEAPPDWSIDREARITAWQQLFAEAGESPSSPTLIVTSNGAARFALLAEPALARSMHQLRSLKLPTGGYGVIEAGANGGLSAPVWGQRP